MRPAEALAPADVTAEELERIEAEWLDAAARATARARRLPRKPYAWPPEPTADDVIAAQEGARR